VQFDQAGIIFTFLSKPIDYPKWLGYIYLITNNKDTKMKHEILYIHESDKDTIKVVDGFAIKDTLKDLGFSFDAETSAFVAPLTQDMHKALIARGFKMNRFIDKTKTTRSI
jgi:dihydroxyacetone kinase-like predicted kinase